MVKKALISPLLVAEIAGASLRTAAWTALIATIGLLTVYSYLVGVHSGLGPWGRIGALLSTRESASWWPC